MNWSHYVYHENECSDLFVNICNIIKKNAEKSISNEAKYMHMFLSNTFVLSFNNKPGLLEALD